MPFETVKKYMVAWYGKFVYAIIKIADKKDLSNA